MHCLILVVSITLLPRLKISSHRSVSFLLSQLHCINVYKVATSFINSTVSFFLVSITLLLQLKISFYSYLSQMTKYDKHTYSMSNHSNIWILMLLHFSHTYRLLAGQSTRYTARQGQHDQPHSKQLSNRLY